MKTVFLCLLALVVLSAATGPSTPDTLVVGSFGVNILDRFAIDKGYYAEKNLNVIPKVVVSSDQQFNSLFSGEYDLIGTAGDNVIYRRLNLGQEQLTVLTETSGSGGMWLLANKNLGINSIQDMEGKTLLVDSPMSGFVIALRKIFKSAGVPLLDSNFIPAGGLNQRIQQLVVGNTNATMSSGGTSPAALANNPHLIKVGDLKPLVCPFVGGQLIATKDWLRSSANERKLVRYIRAQLKAWKYLTNPANKPEVINFFKTSSSVNDAVAQEIFEMSISSLDTGMNAYFVPRRRGLINGVELRVNDLGVSRGPCLPLEQEMVSRKGGWINLSYLAEAAKQELNFNNIFGRYYHQDPVPCEQSNNPHPGHHGNHGGHDDDDDDHHGHGDDDDHRGRH